ncbi:MAG: large-conductance mechanosensitive channel [Candidatus Azotimanducaceae bacterium]|jgi:large-conductance mechanosensitive channel
MTISTLDNEVIGPWNPGIKSTLPSNYLPLSTMFRPENVTTTLETVTELSDFTGLPIQQLIRFRAERLVVHELLIRVSADIFVSDGSKYEDLGVNFRKVVTTLLDDYIQPHMIEIIHRFNDFEQLVKLAVDHELSLDLFAEPTLPANIEKRFSFRNIFRKQKKKRKSNSLESVELRDQRLIVLWQQKVTVTNDPTQQCVLRAMAKIASAIVMKHGRLVGERQLLLSIITGEVCNELGSKMVGDIIAPLINDAAIKENYLILPAQKEPVIINIKGASASGKSTMRPLQKKHTEALDINWHDFALISPDIWRKYLLDYDSLGKAYKYAGTLAGDELPIIDHKLDLYISQKAKQGKLSHLLVDRFRFDSFASRLDAKEGSNLVTRFGHTIYMIFVVTPPEETVERSWKRGLRVGRFKAVDDLLDHNIEALKGMPVLFFTWALRKDKLVYCEFLDNSVDLAKQPKTIAFGVNDELYILDIKCMIDINRFSKININAESSSQVYLSPSAIASEVNTDFLVKCAKKIPMINFVDRKSSKIYACMESGEISWIDTEILSLALEDENNRIGFLAIAPDLIENLSKIERRPARLIPPEAIRHTMGDIS